MKISFSTIAKQDTREIIAYYEEVAPRAAKDFLLSLRAMLRNLVEFSELGKRIENTNLREFPLKNWPYIIPYQILENEIIILRIYHTSRNPKNKT